MQTPQLKVGRGRDLFEALLLPLSLLPDAGPRLCLEAWLPSSRYLPGPWVSEGLHCAAAGSPARDARAQCPLAVLWRPLIGPKHPRPTPPRPTNGWRRGRVREAGGCPEGHPPRAPAPRCHRYRCCWDRPRPCFGRPDSALGCTRTVRVLLLCHLPVPPGSRRSPPGGASVLSSRCMRPYSAGALEGRAAVGAGLWRTPGI